MNEEQLNEALGLIKEARFWMQTEKNRNSPVRIRQEDWQWLIARMTAVEDILDPPKNNPSND